MRPTVVHPGRVPLVDLADDTFIAARPALVAAAVGQPDRWRAWWPDLRLTVARDRGTKGVQWVAGSLCTGSGALAGSLEIWLEPCAGGTLLHHYQRLDALPGRGTPRGRAWAQREWARRSRHWKRHVHLLKDELEDGRAPGERVQAGRVVVR